MWRFFKGWSCGSLVTNRQYDEKWEWSLLSYNYRECEPRTGVIVARRWHWFGIVNRAWGPDGYGHYDRFGDWQWRETAQLGMKRWGWEYQVWIGEEMHWLWPSEFLVMV